MDKHNQLRQMYSSILRLIDCNSIVDLLNLTYPEIVTNKIAEGHLKFDSSPIPTPDEIDETLINYLEKIELEINAYLNLIDSDLNKWIAISRLQKDFEMFQGADLNILMMNRVVRAAKDPIFSDVITYLVDNFYFHLVELGINLQSDMEFDLLGTTPKNSQQTAKRRKEKSSSLKNYQIILLFSLLKKQGIFPTENISLLAEQIGKWTDTGVDQVQQNLNKTTEIIGLKSAHIGKLVKMLDSMKTELETIELELIESEIPK
tara:strand:+ start:39 stop:821 length:783 start_codon:yes stop_codon:yes gene_type:complete